MGKVSYHFFISLFSLILMFVVLVNYLGWSGAYINIISGDEIVSWQNSYFGFQSLNMMIGAMNQLFSNGFFKIENFITTLRMTTNTIQVGLPQLILMIGNQNFNWLEFGWILFQMFGQPLVLFAELMILLGFLLYYALIIIAVLMQAFAGAFNVPFGEDVITASEFVAPVVIGAFA